MGKENVKVEGLDALKKDLEKYFHKTLSCTAGIIADELTDTAYYSIRAFYEDYTPVSYKRHYYNFQENSFRRYYLNSHGLSYAGGVELTPDRMQDIYRDPTDEVFDMVYAGFHGVASAYRRPKSVFTVTPVMQPSPMDLILQKRDEIVKNIDQYVKRGQNAAMKESYAVLNTR